MNGKRLRYVDFENVEFRYTGLGEFEMEVKDVLPAPSPWPGLIARLDLEEALNTLTAYEKLIWHLSAEEGKSFKEIGRIVKKNDKTIAKTLRFIYKKLRRFISS